MTAVLRAKFYRFRRQKSSFVILIIATVFAAFMSYSLGILLGNTPFALNMQKMMSESLNEHLQSGRGRRDDEYDRQL